MLRRFAPAALLFALFAPPMAHAQVNIDQDKSPAHIFASDCSVCHKSTRGLANGRGSSALAGFLAEHYTSSHEEAAAMAAYVLAGGGGVGAAAPVRDPNAAGARDRSSGEDPKTRQARRPVKPEGEQAASGKPKRGKREDTSATAEPSRPGIEAKPAGEHREANAPTRQRDRTKPTETPSAPPSVPARVAVEPKPVEPPKPALTPTAPAVSAAAPQAGESSKSAPARTDNIPD